MSNRLHRIHSLAALFAIAGGCLVAPGLARAQTVHTSPVPKEPCCLNNFRYTGTCTVTPRQGQVCENIRSYLNNINSAGESYCGSTYIRGGWTLVDCGSGAASAPIGTTTTQPLRTEQPGTVNVTSPQMDTNTLHPERAPTTSELGELKVSQANVIQVSLEQPIDGNTLVAGQQLSGRLTADVLGPDGEVVAAAGSTISASLGAENAWDEPSTTSARQLQLVGTTTSAADLFGTAEEAPTAAAANTASVHLTGELVEISEDSVLTFQLQDISEQPADMRVLTSATTVWMEAFNNGDAVTIAGLSSENGALLPPNGRAVIGRDAIYSYWKDLLTDSKTTVELVNIETVVEGDLGYKAGRFELLDTAIGASIDQGKYIQIWKRSPQGYWELHRDMWNSSIGAGKPGT